jgi:hypothetical protein
LSYWRHAGISAGVPHTDREYIVNIELNDGTFEAPWGLHEDTINHRRLCGEGEFDIRSFAECMQKAGYDGLWGIEVLSEELRKKPLDELTTRSFETTMAGMGIPEFEAKRYEGRIKSGGILLSVHCDDSNWTRKAKAILERTGATEIASTGEAAADWQKSDKPLPRAG